MKIVKIETEKFVEDLEETILRLHVHFRKLEEQYDQFKKAKKFLEKIGIKRYSKKLREEIREYREFLYYKGKFYAYLFILENLGSDMPCILKRLRGIIQSRHNELMETKMHYTEVKGLFLNFWLKQAHQLFLYICLNPYFDL